MQRQRKPRVRSATSSLEHQPLSSLTDASDDDNDLPASEYETPSIRQYLAMRARRLARWWWRRRYYVLLLTLATLLEIVWHVRSFDVARPATALDPPFAQHCTPQDAPGPVAADDVPPDAREPREAGVVLMLARNSDMVGAAAAVRSLEARWNTHFRYPYVFLNNEAFSPTFEAAIRAVTPQNASLTFATIPPDMWSWPRDARGAETPPRAHAEAAMARMAAAGLPYAASENYHHMCRFYAGFFAQHPALAPYAWFWRIEPDVEYSCRIPYDPFRRMRLARKTYGYTLALWEVGATAPSLFRAVDDYRRAHSLHTGATWAGMLDASTAPLPLRWALMAQPALFHSRTRAGDAWNMCHFWSNFEIASLDWFRSAPYQRLFAHLDAQGGFFAERWGDAPVHSLAAALLLPDDQLHHFADLGYAHPPLQQCPAETGGCDCECPDGLRTPPDTCLRRLRAGVEP